MSDVCGIFYKSCPQCAMAIAKSAMGCHCGYSFEDETPTSAMAQSLAEEKLYEDYLLARVTQTAQAAIDAQAAQKRQPADTSLNIAALTAMELAETARRDLAAQSARVEELRQAVAAEATNKLAAATPAPTEPAHSPAAIHAAAPAAEAPASARAAEVARAAEALRSELAKLRHPDERAAGNNPALTPARVLRAVASEQRSGRAVNERALTRNDNASDTLRDATSEATRSETHAPASDAHAPAAVAPTNPVAKKNCPQCDAAVIASANRCRCGFAFVAHAAPANVPKIEDVLARAQELKQARRESAQAQKAARIREARLARAAAKPAPATPGVVAVNADAPRAETAQTEPAPTAKPGPAAVSSTPESELSASVAGTVVSIDKSGRQRAASLSPARPLATAARDVKECPNCTANVAAHASRCNCGFEFRDVSATSPMPALRLDDGELLKVQDLYVRR